MWDRIDETVSAVIDHTTFADLTRAWRERHNQYVPNWDI
jgi:hypothetical protein